MEVGILEAKTRFSELVGRAERGEEVKVTRRGKVVARIVPEKRGMTHEEMLAWLEGVRKNREGMKPTTTEETKAMTHEGHRY